nr:MAG TPA: hypothetical protein [Caudoviricetes sp.]
MIPDQTSPSRCEHHKLFHHQYTHFSLKSKYFSRKVLQDPILCILIVKNKLTELGSKFPKNRSFLQSSL